MGQPVYRYLEEFGVKESRATPVVVNLRGRPEPQPQPRSDAIAERLHEAYEKGREAGEAAACEVARRDRELLTADCERRIQQTKSAFGAAVGQELALGLKNSLDELGTTLSNDVCSILLPLISRHLAEETARQLADEIKAVFMHGAVLSIEINGPDELVDSFIARLEQDPAWSDVSRPQLRRSRASGTELRVLYDRSAIETRLGEWIEAVNKAID